MRPAIFFDKDGTLIEDVPYNVDPELVALSAGAGAGMRRLAALGYRLFVVSNQPGLGLGRFDEAALHAAWRQLQRLAWDEEVRLEGFYYCPHQPDSGCNCRKPEPGLLLKASREHGIDLAASWMIGDILNDVEAGRRAGCRTILIDNGHETEWVRGEMRTPDLIAPDVDAAARLVEASHAASRGLP